METEKKPSLKRRACLILLLVLAPFSLIFIIFSVRVIKNIDMQTAQSFSGSLGVFCSGVQKAFIKADAFLFRDCRGEESFARIGDAQSPSAAREAGAVTADLAATLLDTYPELTGVLLYNPENDFYQLLLQSAVTYNKQESEELEVLFTELSLLGRHENLGWTLTKDTLHPYFFRVASDNGSYAICFADMDKLTAYAQILYGLSTPVVFFSQNEPITDSFWLRQYDGSMTRPQKVDDTFFIRSGARTYMVVTRRLLGLQAVYAVAYQRNSGWILLSVALFITATLLAFAVIWGFLKKRLFHPLDALVGVMHTVQRGNLSVRSQDSGGSDEFSCISTTFNHMLDTISSLKIERYEQRLTAKRLEMDALRLQIRPHFFLNCLKGIYGLAQSGQPHEIQKMVLLLSSHLRFTLDLSQNDIPLSQELYMCENYLALHGIGQRHSPICIIMVDEALMDVCIPPVSLLSLVENAVKYGSRQQAALEVTITGRILKIDDNQLMQLVVKDNGPGFPQELLNDLNHDAERLAAQGHIGVANVLRRFRLLYGASFSFLFSNRNGAYMELLLPLGQENALVPTRHAPQAERNDGLHETFDC